jgi:hypothetical protein
VSELERLLAFRDEARVECEAAQRRYELAAAVRDEARVELEAARRRCELAEQAVRQGPGN